MAAPDNFPANGFSCPQLAAGIQRDPDLVAGWYRAGKIPRTLGTRFSWEDALAARDYSAAHPDTSRQVAGLSAVQVADRLKVLPTLIQRWARKGHIPRSLGSRFSEADVRAASTYLNSRLAAEARYQ